MRAGGGAGVCAWMACSWHAWLFVRAGGSFTCHASRDNRWGALTGRLRVCVRVGLAPVHGVQGLGLCARRGKSGSVCSVLGEVWSHR